MADHVSPVQPQARASPSRTRTRDGYVGMYCISAARIPRAVIRPGGGGGAWS